MKNSILSSVVLVTLLASTLLSSSSLYGMQLHTLDDDSSYEVESLSEEETEDVQSTTSVGAFFASQVAGARELLSYGRHAAEDLAALMTQSNSLDTQKTKNVVETSAVMDTLVKCFLNDGEKYQKHIRFWSKDIRTLLARYILLNHPLIKIINARLQRHVCCDFLANKGDLAILVHFDGARDRIVTASRNMRDNKTAKIWNVASGECPRTLRGHISAVSSAQFNGAGDKIVTASNDNTAKLWDVASGECLHTLECHDYLYSAQFNTMGNRIVTAAGRTAKLWDVVSGECLYTLQDHEGSVFSAQFNTAGDRIITASRDGTIKIWDVASGECLQTLQCPGGIVNSARFNAAGDRIVTASHDGAARIWDTASYECLQTLQCHGRVDFISAKFNGAGDRIVTAYRDRTAKIWDVASGKCLHMLQGYTDLVYFAEFNTAGDKIVTASYDGIVKFWDISRLEAITQWLEKDYTLEQALLLHCIYETRVAHVLLKKRNKSNTIIASLRFDFNACPYLEKHFDSMPPEVQVCLEPFITRGSIVRIRGRLPS